MEKELELEIGHTYLTRDNRKVVIYGEDTVFNEYRGVVLYTQEFVSYQRNGSFLQSKPSHNDLVVDLSENSENAIKQISED